jgi:hypothetical protein
MRAKGGVSFITLPAIKARTLWKRGWGSAGKIQRSPLPFTSGEVKGKEWDQKQKNPDRPEKSPPHGVSLFLGIKKNPESDNRQNDEKD